MLNHSVEPPDGINILKALLGKLDIKRHYLHVAFSIYHPKHLIYNLFVYVIGH